MLDICVLRLGVKEQRWLGDDKLAAYRHSHQIFKAPNILAAGWFGITLFQTWRGIISRSLSFILNEVSNLVIALRVWILHFHTIKTNQMSCRLYIQPSRRHVCISINTRDQPHFMVLRRMKPSDWSEYRK